MRFNWWFVDYEAMETEEKVWLSRVTQWRKYFAWKPVRIGKKECVWLEYVKRKYIVKEDGREYWEYKQMSEGGTGPV